VMRTLRLGIAAVLAVAAASAAIAGCGEDSEVSNASEPEGLAGEPDADAIEAFRECMSEQGIDVPETGFRFGGPPGGEGGDVPEQPSGKQLRALQACRDELPMPPGGEEGPMLFGGPPPSG
jgi:hypothetical protein